MCKTSSEAPASELVFISFRRSRKELLCAERNLSRRQANLSPGTAGKFSLLEKQMIIRRFICTPTGVRNFKADGVAF